MKMYKRILAFALAVLFVLAVCACSPAEKPVDLKNPEGGQNISDKKTFSLCTGRLKQGERLRRQGRNEQVR